MEIRRNTPAFADKNNLKLHPNSNPHIFMFERTNDFGKDVLVICNFDENIQMIEVGTLTSMGYLSGGKLKDLVSGKNIILKWI